MINAGHEADTNMKCDNDMSRRAAAVQLNDSGFTLVELIVGITVMLFVMLSLVVFVSIGTRGYSTSSAEVSLQMESQIAMSQVEDIVMEGMSLSEPMGINGCTVYAVTMTDGRVLLILDRANERLLQYTQAEEDITDRNGIVLPVTAGAVQDASDNYRDCMIVQGITSLSLVQPDKQASLVNVETSFKRPGKSRDVSCAYRMRNFVNAEE